MFSRRYRSALLCICSSLLGLLAGGGAAADSSLEQSLELELSLARSRSLYLVVDAASATLDVKARGMVLDRTPLSAVAMAAAQPVLGRRQWPELELPTLWRVSEAPSVEWRRVVAPPELRRYGDAVESTPTPAPTRVGGAVPPEVPARYSMTVDGGWQLVITDRVGTSLWSRLCEAGGDSWRRWTGGGQPPRPPRLVLTMAPDDARRLLRVFRAGLPILVVAKGVGGATEGKGS